MNRGKDMKTLRLRQNAQRSRDKEDEDRDHLFASSSSDEEDDNAEDDPGVARPAARSNRSVGEGGVSSTTLQKKRTAAQKARDIKAAAKMRPAKEKDEDELSQPSVASGMTNTRKGGNNKNHVFDEMRMPVVSVEAICLRKTDNPNYVVDHNGHRYIGILPGDRPACELCGQSYQSFKQFGSHTWNNKICPHGFHHLIQPVNAQMKKQTVSHPRLTADLFQAKQRELATLKNQGRIQANAILCPNRGWFLDPNEINRRLRPGPPPPVGGPMYYPTSAPPAQHVGVGQVDTAIGQPPALPVAGLKDPPKAPSLIDAFFNGLDFSDMEVDEIDDYRMQEMWAKNMCHPPNGKCTVPPSSEKWADFGKLPLSMFEPKDCYLASSKKHMSVDGTGESRYPFLLNYTFPRLSPLTHERVIVSWVFGGQLPCSLDVNLVEKVDFYMSRSPEAVEEMMGNHFDWGEGTLASKGYEQRHCSFLLAVLFWHVKHRDWMAVWSHFIEKCWLVFRKSPMFDMIGKKVPWEELVVPMFRFRRVYQKALLKRLADDGKGALFWYPSAKDVMENADSSPGQGTKEVENAESQVQEPDNDPNEEDMDSKPKAVKRGRKKNIDEEAKQDSKGKPKGRKKETKEVPAKQVEEQDDTLSSPIPRKGNTGKQGTKGTKRKAQHTPAPEDSPTRKSARQQAKKKKSTKE